MYVVRQFNPRNAPSILVATVTYKLLPMCTCILTLTVFPFLTARLNLIFLNTTGQPFYVLLDIGHILSAQF